MSVFMSPTERVLRSMAYRAMIENGYAMYVPFPVANALCSLRGVDVRDLGLSWETVPGTGTGGIKRQVGVPTVPLLLALGYGRRQATLTAWIGYWRALRQVGR